MRVQSILWRVLVWALVLSVAVCAIGGYGPAGDGPLYRLGAIGFAGFLVFILVRFEMLMRSGPRGDT